MLSSVPRRGCRRRPAAAAASLTVLTTRSGPRRFTVRLAQSAAARTEPARGPCRVEGYGRPTTAPRPASAGIRGGVRWRCRARAFWLREPGVGEIRPVDVPDPRPGEVLVRTLRSAVSRGTETLVFRGGVPAGPVRRDAGTVPGGRLPRPGEVRLPQRRPWWSRGPRDLLGRTVFCLYPHQTAYVVPAAAVVSVPEGVPPERAVLAGTVETAVNALWDAAPLVGDRVTVVGARHGRALRRPAARRHPGGRGHGRRRRPGEGGRRHAPSGATFALPADAAGGRDLVVHASALVGRAAALASTCWRRRAPSSTSAGTATPR